jgi:hypothetical protein
LLWTYPSFSSIIYGNVAHIKIFRISIQIYSNVPEVLADGEVYLLLD